MIEVRELTCAGLNNPDTSPRTKTVGQILRDNLLTAFHALNLALAAAVLLTGSVKNALFMGVVILNAGIGIFQELRAKRLTDRLSLIASPHVTVIREGSEAVITKEEVVLGDLMLLRAGDQIAADAQLVGGCCEANESLLTGESDAITKREGDILSSGSYLVSGSCFARVIHVGADNYAAKITERAKHYERPESEIMKAVNRIIKAVAIAIVPIGIALFCKQYFIMRTDPATSVLSTAAALIGMIPEGLVLLTSVVMAVSTIRLAGHGALVQELYSVEMLARADVLCLDKTGTITKGSMKVCEVRPTDGHSREELLAAAGYVVYGLGDDNATALAIKDYVADPFAANAASTERKAAAEPDETLVPVPSERVAFSSSRKWSGIRIGDTSYMLGAVQFLLRGHPELIDDICCETKDGAARGERVLAAAISKENLGDGTVPDDITLLGLIYITDEIRESAPATLRFFREQGVDIRIISGDDALAVSKIAARAGLDGAESCIDATVLDTPEKLREAVGKYNVFGRVTPEQKAEFVRALKEQGHIVAMTGDGVNDVMALRESDCSIAMAAGADAARNVSRIVLLDSDFASMPEIVAEGRRSINNLQRSSTLFLTKTVFSAIAAMVFIFLAATYPIQPIQFTLISALTIGVPSFVLALQPNRERVRGRFLDNVLRSSLPGGVTDAIIVIAISAVGAAMNRAQVQTGTIAAVLIAFIGFMVLCKISFPFDGLRAALIIVMMGAFMGACLLFGSFFEFAPFDAMLLQKILPFFALALAVYLLLLFAVSKIFKKDRI